MSKSIHIFKPIESVTYSKGDESESAIHTFETPQESIIISSSSSGNYPDLLVIPVKFEDGQLHDYPYNFELEKINGIDAELEENPGKKRKQNPRKKSVKKNPKKLNYFDEPEPGKLVQKIYKYTPTGKTASMGEWVGVIKRLGNISEKKALKFFALSPLFVQVSKHNLSIPYSEYAELTFLQNKINDWKEKSVKKNPKKIKKNPQKKRIVSPNSSAGGLIIDIVKKSKKPTSTEENRLLREYLLSHKNIKISPYTANIVLKLIGKDENVPVGERFAKFKAKHAKYMNKAFFSHANLNQ